MSKLLERLLAEKAEKKAKETERRRKKRIKEDIKRRSRKRAVARKEKEKAKKIAETEKRLAKEKEAKRKIAKKRHEEAVARAKRKYYSKIKRENRENSARQDKEMEKYVLKMSKRLEELEAEDEVKQRINKEKRRIRHSRKYDRDRNRANRKLAFDELVAEEAKEGNKYSEYWIILAKNCKKVKSLKKYKWSKEAFADYERAVKENDANVTYAKADAVSGRTEYEILVLEKCPDEDSTAMFRNEYGKFEENTVVGNGGYRIVAKHPWKIEETFGVCGYNNRTDRKTFSFIKDELIMKELSIETMKMILVYKNNLVIQKNDDIDIVMCKSKEDAARLYGELQKAIGNNNYILFSGNCAPGLVPQINGIIKEKRAKPGI